MTTTAVFAEILTVGLQALAWIALAAWVIARWDDPSTLSLDDIKGWLTAAQPWTALFSVVVLAMAYTVGVVVDRVADTLLGLAGRLARKVGRRFKTRGADETKPKTRAKASGPSRAEKRLYVRYRDGQLSGFFEYVRSRLRVVRSTVLNVLMAGIFGGLALRHSPWLMTVICVAVFTLAMTIYAWVRIKWVYEQRLEQAYRLIQSEGDSEANR